MEVNFKKIEKKWQDRWEKKKIFQVNEKSGKKKFYVLEMFPYPSGSGLHMGHAFNYVIGDIYARFRRMQGFNVLYPMGYDSLGLPAENAAIKEGIHPKKYTEASIKNFIRQQKELGLSYDWNRLVKSSDPSYYKWDQWIFLQMLKRGIAFRKKAAVNYCSKCRTVLANEQVHDGKCWRHEDTSVEIKQLEQWFFKITDYADELYEDIDKLKGWPEDVKAMQRNWIGKSHGIEIDFEIPTNANFVLLHGYTGSPNANFFPWLKKELESRRYKVSVPKLPNTNNPNIAEQADYVIKNCKFDENTILLGHSLGSVIALKVVEQLSKPIKKLILAAGFIEPNTKDRPYVKTFDWKFNLEKIKNNAGQIIILKDKNDKEIRKEAANKLKNAIGGEIIEFEAQEQHICGDKEPAILDYCLEKWQVFTTRPDTIYGVTFMVISAQHPRLFEIVTDKQKKQVEEFLKRIKSTSEKENASSSKLEGNLDELEKQGVFTGSYAVNPVTKEKVPVYAGNFVVADYGCGMVMAVPCHDERDFQFAKKYKISVKIVIQNKDKSLNEKTMQNAYTEEGILVNSGRFNGLNSKKAIEEISNYIEKEKLGRKTINFRLKDWLISRQRYWGTPIPVVYCEKCGAVPVPEKELPVKLPEKVKFGKGNPLETSKEFVNVKCPKCRGKGKRETDTMDTFVNSSWYFLKYCDSKNNKEIFDRKKTDYWMPIDRYIGGKEHACMHLIYFRFYTKFLRDLGLLKIDEPALNLFNQGMLHGNDGAVMSKSRGNIVLPEEVSRRYGIDTARLFLMSQASPDKDTQWSENGIQGSYRFINKVVEYFSKIKFGKVDARLESRLNNTIREITEDIEEFRYNLAIINLRELFNSFEEIDKKAAEAFLKMLSLFCPHICEELWSRIGGKGFISLSEWPVADEKKINKKFEEQDKAIETLKNDINNIIRIIEARGEKKENVYVYVLPKEKEIYDEKLVSEKIGKKVRIFAVNDKNKHDPTGKSKNSKPGKPAIYLE